MILDAHTHILPKEIIRNKDRYAEVDSTFSELFHGKKCKFSTCEELIDNMKETGISKSVILGMGWTDHAVNGYVNEYLIDSSKRYPEQLIPFTGIIPSFSRSSLTEAERCLGDGSKGFGEVHATSQQINITDVKLMGPFMELLSEYDLPITIHCSEPVGHLYPGKGATTPNLLETFVKRFSKNKIIMAHWGGGLPFYELMPEIKYLFKNVLYDTAASPLLYNKDIFNFITKMLGPEKILFGSDFPLISPNKIINQIDESDLIPEEKQLIFFENLLTLI